MTALQLAISIDRPDRTYLQGEYVTGTLAVTTTEPVECRELTVALGHRFAGERGRGEGTEASAQLFEGSWEPGTHVLPFSLPVKAELPTYEGQLFTITRMIRARAVLAHQSPVVQVAVVQIACHPRDDSWFDPREQQLPPVAFALNDAPVRLDGLQRAVERGVGRLLGIRRPATVEVTPRVLVGGGSVAISASSPGMSRRLPRLRARLLGVEEWPRDGRPLRRVVHRSDLAPTVAVDASGTTLDFTVPLPEDACSIDPMLRWRIELHGAYGCLDHRDRWQPLWVGPSPASLERLRNRPPEQLAAAEASLRAGESTSRLRLGFQAAFALLALVVFPIAIVLFNAPGGARIKVLAWAAGFCAVIALVVGRKRSVERAFRESLYRDARAAGADEAGLAPPHSEGAAQAGPIASLPAPPMVVELLTVGESPLAPEIRRQIRGEAIETQRRILRRGIRGLVFLLAISLIAGMAGPISPLTGGFGVPLTLFSVLVIVASRLAKPTGRPLSCYVGFAPVLVLVWLVRSIALSIASAAAITQWSVRGAAEPVLLAVGAAVVIYMARRTDPSPPRGRRLLVLWVFGTSSRMEEIMREVALQWVYLGPIQYLRGPGSRADLGKLIAALRGGAREFFADTRPEVLAHLRRFRFTPNIFGIYALNSIQCTDAAWRDALDALVDTTDLVMMDLTAFGKNNRGCAYELGVLLARLPTSRFVLVVDGTTDIHQLTALLQERWETMPPGSPNRQGTPGAVRLFHIPLRGAVAKGQRWLDLPMTDLVEVLYAPLAEEVPPA